MFLTYIWLLAQTNFTPSFIFSPPWFWLTMAFIFSGMELLLSKKWANKLKFVPLIMGVSALIVSFILYKGAILLAFEWQYIMYEGLDMQIMYWMGLSLTGVIWFRPMFIPRKKFVIPDATEAKTITAIPPGKTGRVLYEGCSWQAACAEIRVAITAQEKVYVLRREGNTLIVLPENLFHS